MYERIWHGKARFFQQIDRVQSTETMYIEVLNECAEVKKDTTSMLQKKAAIQKDVGTDVDKVGRLIPITAAITEVETVDEEGRAVNVLAKEAVDEVEIVDVPALEESTAGVKIKRPLMCTICDPGPLASVRTAPLNSTTICPRCIFGSRIRSWVGRTRKLGQ